MTKPIPYGEVVNVLSNKITETVWELSDRWDDEEYLRVFEALGHIAAVVLSMKTKKAPSEDEAL